jgi:hypothetical protein
MRRKILRNLIACAALAAVPVNAARLFGVTMAT